MNRRGFLRFLGVAPVMAPVVMTGGLSLKSTPIVEAALDTTPIDDRIAFMPDLRHGYFLTPDDWKKIHLRPSDITHLKTRRFERHEIFGAYQSCDDGIAA